MTFPSKVLLREVGPREGFQTLKKIVPTNEKLELIRLLASAGAPEIEVASFVRPDRVPQMADAEEIIQGLPQANILYKGLYLNAKGFERAEQTGRLSNEAWLYTAASATFLKKNNNTTQEKFYESIPGWIELFRQYQKPLHGIMISTVFGCNDEGTIPPETVMNIIEEAQKRVSDSGERFQEVSLADTVGLGNPENVRKMIGEIRTMYPSLRVSLHLHDTRGSGMANVYAGLMEGIDCFEASVGGLGGCPFAKGAAGNVVTEDVAYLCESLGISTGIDLERYAQAAEYAESITGLALPGKYFRVCRPQT
ncbi:MAG: hydroxymethylglutaryl-CoA lyase [Bdellovibrionales bacterium]|nr:hydroxymethylglutaryl-CoA lyase [Bdellovibrionales bacterium]